MFIEKIEQNFVKLNFYTNEEEIHLGDLVKVVSAGKKGILVQIIKVESPDGNQDYNTATSKILFTLEDSGKLINWQGNLPGNDFAAIKLEPQEVLSVTNTIETTNSMLFAGLSCYPETVVNIDISALEKPSVVVVDKEEQKNDFLEFMAGNLAENKAKTLLVDFNGEFIDAENSLVLKAGKNIKLPFDLKGLEILYDKILSGVAPDIRAGIENIFTEIEDYLSSNNVSFIPFKVFLDAVNAECQENKTPELNLLANSLAKLHKKGIFADEQGEITSLFKSFKENNFIVLDLSEINKDWKSLFVDALVRLNSSKAKRKLFLLMDINKLEDTTEIIEQLFSKGIKSGIKPIVSLNHKSDFMETVLAKTSNMFVFSMQDKSKLTFLKPYLARINSSDMLISGKMTNNVPLYIKSPVSDEIEQEIFLSQEAVAPDVQEEYAEHQKVEVSDEEQVSESYETASEEYQQECAEEATEEYEQDVQEEALEVYETASEEYEQEEVSETYETKQEPAGEYADLSELGQETYQEETEEVEEQEETAYQETYEEAEKTDEVDENFDYFSSEEFQDESVLDYVSVKEEEPASNKTRANEQEFSDDDLKQFMDYDDESEKTEEVQEESDYETEEEVQEEYAATEDYSSEYDSSSQKFSDDDLKQFIDYDETSDKKKPVKKVKTVKMPGPSAPNLPVYDIPGEEEGFEMDLQEGDTVLHKKYGIGVINKVIGYSEKKLCSIQFEDVGRRLLDPKLAELEKVE